MNLALLRVLRTIIRADSDPVRQALFANLAQSRTAVRLVYRAHGRLGPTGAALLVSCYGLAAFLRVAPLRKPNARVVALASHENAQRQVASVVSWVGEAECDWVNTRLSAWVVLVNLLKLVRSGGRGFKACRIVRAIDARHGFLVACRAASAMAWYAQGKAILGGRRAGAVLVSSDSNPEEVGFVGAARALRIADIFVSHAYPTPLSPPLDFRLSILEGDAAVEARRERGPIAGAVLLAGVEGDSAPMDPRRFTRANPVVGIFTPKAISWPVMTALLDDCRDYYRARKIVIRWHPSMLEPSRPGHVLRDRRDIVESPPTASLIDVARQCDWVIADQNSNVHLPVLKLGIPTIGVSSLGPYPRSRADMYGFAAHGIVFPPVESIRDVCADMLLSFYSEGWAARFARYDASYLTTQDAVAINVRRAIRALIEAPVETSAGA